MWAREARKRHSLSRGCAVMCIAPRTEVWLGCTGLLLPGPEVLQPEGHGTPWSAAVLFGWSWHGAALRDLPAVSAGSVIESRS